MAELKVYISEELDKKFRILAMSIFGYGRGSLSEAAVEALSVWCKERESKQDNLRNLKPSTPDSDPVVRAEERPGILTSTKEKDTGSVLEQGRTDGKTPQGSNGKTETEAGPTKPKSKGLDRSTPGKTSIKDLVAGILLDKGRFLVEQRRLDNEADPGYVEIPGGHVERGETFEEALRREMMEELGIKVESARMIGKALTTATNGERGRIHYFHIDKWQGRIQSNEAERVYWESDISKLTIIPDQRAIRNLVRA